MGLSKDKQCTDNQSHSVMATPQGTTVDGFETQFGTNHLSHFLLFNLLKPLFLNNTNNNSSSTPARIVSVSSLGHRIAPTRPHDLNFSEPDSYSPWVAYGQAKTANIHLANGITHRYGSSSSNGARKINALSLHPGGIMTGLQVHLPDEQVKVWQEDPNMNKYLKSVEQGAATSVYAALGKEFEGKGALYLSDCAVQGPFKLEDPMATGDEGYAKWAFDREAEDLLWEKSLEMVGLGKEE